MIGGSVFIFIALCTKWSSAQFLNHRPYPTYSLEDMPDTGFSCRDKILGGYYADPETQCQMFHVCVKVSGVGVQDFRFLCSNGTAFDQDHQICADWQDVDCDATTLYYSSDNFDLYRIGSGFESKAVKYGEDEEPFSLQRAETGDVRINREHQSQRINQQRETFNYRPTTNNYQQNRNANRNSYNNNNNNSEKDIFKGSSSSNFFNNRNGGKENDEEEYESENVNANQDNDEYQKRKSARGKQNRRPNYENQTEKPRISTGFANNFAGSSYLPSTTTTIRPLPTTTENVQVQYNTRGRQRGRVSPQYNNADNFRQSTNKNYEDDGRYRGENYYNRNPQPTQYTVSTPAPFQQNLENSTPKYSNPTTFAPQRRSTENYPTPYNQPQQKYSNNQNTPTKATDNYPTSQAQPRETEIYRNNPQGHQQYYNDQYETTKVKPYENYPTGYSTQNKKQTTPVKQTDNYPTTYAPKISKDYKNVVYTEQSSTPVPQTKSTYNQQTSTYNKQNTQYTPTVNYHHQQYDHSRVTNTQAPTNHQQYDNSKTTNTHQQYDSRVPSNNPTSSNQQYDNARVTNTQIPTTHQQYDNTRTTYNQTPDNSRITNTQAPNNHQQYDSRITSSKPSNNNQQYDNARVTNTQTASNHQQFDNSKATQPTNNLPKNFKETPLYNPPSHPKQTTQYTQYTPTVPRVTTPSYAPTTTAIPRRSNRFDETQYDDGSYNSKYDNEDDKNNKEDEFLKTAHSINFASSRNEYIQNSKNAQVSTTQKPRPFSVTPNSIRSTELLSTSNTGNTQNTSKFTATINKSSVSPPIVNAKKPTPVKKVKDVSYDYAYYDTNVGNEHDYDIGVDIEKSDKLTSKKQ